MNDISLTKWELDALLQLLNSTQVQGKENMLLVVALIEKLEKAQAEATDG